MEIALNNLNDRFFPVFQDVGETTQWGHPCFEKQLYDENRGKRMIQVPTMAWRIMELHGISPDVILIDGRFRVASFLAVILNASKPCTIIFDDYIDRSCH